MVFIRYTEFCLTIHNCADRISAEKPNVTYRNNSHKISCSRLQRLAMRFASEAKQAALITSGFAHSSVPETKETYHSIISNRQIFT